MAKHKREYHTCDFCGIEMAKPFLGGEAGTYSIRMEEDFAVAGNVLTIQELCGPCHHVIRGIVADIKARMKGAQADRRRAEILKETGDAE